MSNNLQIKDRLENSDLLITGRLVDASNATLFGHLAEDEEFKIIYKPVAGERPLWDFPSGSLAAREYAAYLFSEKFGFNLVPLTVLREGPYGYGMVQQWINDAQPEYLIEIAQEKRQSLRKMVLFDALINNADRKFGHILLLSENIFMGCDHGVTFHVEDKLRTVLWQFAGEELYASEVTILNQVIDHNFDELTEFLSTQEIAAIISRSKNMLLRGKLPTPSNERPSIPWPPV